MGNLDDLLLGYRAFRLGTYRQNEEKYRQLAERQQDPKAMIICCCDSRADPAMIFSAEPGELFVVRNVANVVPPYQPDDRRHGTSAALEFGITVLEIADLIVMGHAKCGGVAALHGSLKNRIKGEFIPQWVDVIRPVAEAVMSEAPHLETDQLRRTIERQAVIHSLAQLMTFPFIRERVDAGTLRLHGMFYGIGSGMLEMFNQQSRAFEPVAV